MTTIRDGSAHRRNAVRMGATSVDEAREVAAGLYVDHFGELSELLCLVRHGDTVWVDELRAIIQSHRESLDVIEGWLDADEAAALESALSAAG